MRRNVVTPAARGLGAALAVVAGASCGADRRGSSEVAASFVGREACIRCHEAEGRRWDGSHHDLAMQEASAETILGDFRNVAFTQGDVTSTFYRDGDRFFVRTDGPDGELAEYPVAYTFGVTPLQQYLVPLPGGRYQALPIAWDSRSAEEGGQRWFHLYPGAAIDADSPLHWTRPRQNWNTACAECHSTALTRGFDVESRTFRSRWSELDVSCEACHGPGSRHVALAQGEEDMGPSAAAGRPPPRGGWGLTVTLRRTGRAWSFAPEGWTAELSSPSPTRAEVEVCAPCHARRATIADGFVPGGRLLDSYAVSLLREGLYHPDGQIQDEVYVYGSFVQSRMYRAGVTCSDCHDPHSLDTRAEGNALCARCHRPERYDDPSHHFHPRSSPGASCVECHMPSRTYMVVDPRRDHSIRIPRPDLSREIGVPNACNGCHADRSVAWAAEAAERWYGAPESPPHFAEAIRGGRAGDPAAFPVLTDVAGDEALPPIVRATALSLLGGYRRAAVEDAVRTGLADPEPLVRIGALEAAAVLPPSTILSLALPSLQDSVRAVRLRAARRVVAVPDASTAGRAAAVARSWAQIDSAHEASLSSSSAWVELGDLRAAAGRAEEAEAAFRTALAVDSTDLPAYLNLADLQRALGRDDLAGETLARARTMDPEAAETHHALGLLEVRQGDLPGALEWLERAASLRPANPRFAYVYGVALHSSGAVADGVRVLEDALRAHPYDSDILAALAAYARERGETGEALRFARRLVEVIPEDPGARDLLARLRAEGR